MPAFAPASVSRASMRESVEPLAPDSVSNPFQVQLAPTESGMYRPLPPPGASDESPSAGAPVSAVPAPSLPPPGGLPLGPAVAGSPAWQPSTADNASHTVRFSGADHGERALVFMDC